MAKLSEAFLDLFFFCPQVWPDYPDISMDPSLDWDSQIEVKGTL